MANSEVNIAQSWPPTVFDGATSETVDCQAYFVYAETYYKPFYSGSGVVYVVVEKPKA